MKLPVVLVIALPLSACADRYSEPALPADHPANPAAATGPALPRSETLDAAGSDTVGTTGPADGAPPVPNLDEPESGARPVTAAAAVFACPMHPEVTSPDPDARCRRCGMRLERVDGEGAP